MTKKNLQWVFRFFLLIGMVTMVTFYGCKKDEEDPPPANPIASFQFAISGTNFLEVTFTNFSQNATSYSWNFGDSQTSTETSPVHVYTAAGSYTVVLTAKNDVNASATYTQTVEITDPNAALALLAGTTQKTWRLFREESCMGCGPDATAPRAWWALGNTGERPCYYYQEFTFKRDGSFVFDDKGAFFGEGDIFDGTAVVWTCFEAIAANMINKNGIDVSTFLSGTHAYTYEPSTGEVTLNGNGAWMGLPQFGTTAAAPEPVDTKTFKISIEQKLGYDLMTICYAYEGIYWDMSFASYSDPSLEPDVVEELIPYGEDLPDFAPTEFFNTFNSSDPADVQYLIPTESAVTLTSGNDDPVNPSGPKVGMYVRGTQQYADLKFQQEFDIQFDNFNAFKIDVYLPSTNTYSEGGLTKNIQVWIADQSQTQEFWNSWVQYDVPVETIPLDEWKTYTFDLETPSAGTGTPKTRVDLDLVGLVIGGSNHLVDGTFYVRNFTFFNR